MGKEYRLFDYTAGLPKRTDLVLLSKKFRWLNSNNNGSKWNVPHHWIVDYFFLNSPMAEHYKAYLKATSKHSHKIFKGQLLNQMIITYLIFLEHPHRYGDNGIVPIMKCFGTWKNTFIRRYNGLLNHGKYNLKEMLSLAPLDNKSYRYKIKFARRYADRIHRLILDRALSIQDKFRTHVLEGRKLAVHSEDEDIRLPWRVEVDERHLLHEW